MMPAIRLREGRRLPRYRPQPIPPGRAEGAIRRMVPELSQRESVAYFFDDFFGNAYNDYVWNASTLRSGVVEIQQFTGVGGVVMLRVGPEPHSSASLYTYANQLCNHKGFRMIVEFRACLSDPTNIVANMGVRTIEVPYGAYLIHAYYKAGATPSVWELKTQVGETVSRVPTRLRGDKVYHVFRIEAMENMAILYIDGARMAETRTNVPSSVYEITMSVRNTARVERVLYVDYVWALQTRSADAMAGF